MTTSELYVLTDAAGDWMDEYVYADPERAIDARAHMMAGHPDGDAVTVEVFERVN